MELFEISDKKKLFFHLYQKNILIIIKNSTRGLPPWIKQRKKESHAFLLQGWTQSGIWTANKNSLLLFLYDCIRHFPYMNYVVCFNFLCGLIFLWIAPQFFWKSIILSCGFVNSFLIPKILYCPPLAPSCNQTHHSGLLTEDLSLVAFMQIENMLEYLEDLSL